MEKIADSPTALDIFNKASGKEAKLNLLMLVCRELARQHRSGVLQRDLHLGNFVVDGDKVLRACWTGAILFWACSEREKPFSISIYEFSKRTRLK